MKQILFCRAARKASLVNFPFLLVSFKHLKTTNPQQALHKFSLRFKTFPKPNLDSTASITPFAKYKGRRKRQLSFFDLNTYGKLSQFDERFLDEYEGKATEQSAKTRRSKHFARIFL